MSPASTGFSSFRRAYATIPWGHDRVWRGVELVWPKPWHSILWAPWRLSYIKDAASRKEEGCVFCSLASEEPSAENLVLYRGRLSYIVMNRYPYNSGHLMVIPYKHTSTVEELDGETLKEMMLLVKASVKALRKVYNPHGFNIGINMGEAAGAGIAGHIHIHIVPRWVGDTNFMTITAGVKVVPQSLEDAWRQLSEVIGDAVDEVMREERE